MTSYRTPLKDNSWIKKPDSEDEDVDRDPNYGKTILGHVSVTSTRDGSDGSMLSALGSTYSPTRSSTSTTTLTKGGKTTTTETTTIVRSATNKRTETFSERVLSSSKGYSTYSTPKPVEVSKTTITSVKDAEDHLYETLDPSPTLPSYSPTDSKKSVITTETVTVRNSSDAQAEDQLYDRLIPKSIKDEASNGGTSLSSTDTVILRSSTIGGDGDAYDGFRTKSISDQYSLDRDPTVTSSTSIRRYSSYTEDSPISSTTSYTISTKPSDDYSSESKTYTYSSSSSSSRPSSTYEYSSITSPSSYSSTTYRTSSRSDDSLSDPIYSKSTTKNVYSSSDRTFLEKDLCTSCRKPFTGDAKMVLEDIKVNCHATCFKCAVCNSTLGNLKAGDSLWVYRGIVHCDNCFEVTKAKWRR